MEEAPQKELLQSVVFQISCKCEDHVSSSYAVLDNERLNNYLAIVRLMHVRRGLDQGKLPCTYDVVVRGTIFYDLEGKRVSSQLLCAHHSRE